jgi:hypothetical protein
MKNAISKPKNSRFLTKNQTKNKLKNKTKLAEKQTIFFIKKD